MKASITTFVADGRITKNREELRQIISQFEGKEVSISVNVPRKSRTHPQNAYYWGVVVPLAQVAVRDSWGEFASKEEIHELLKTQFCFDEKINEISGEVIRIPKSTTELNTVQMEEYLEQVRAFIQEWFDVTVPLPNEDLNLEL